MASFECTLLHTDSTTMVQWLKDNKPLEDKLADRLTASAVGKTFKLTLQNVLESDSGIYIARAMNSEGQSTCTAQLVVQKRKFVMRKPYATSISSLNRLQSHRKRSKQGLKPTPPSSWCASRIPSYCRTLSCVSWSK